jgi:Zn-dependent protease with chaperone function
MSPDSIAAARQILPWWSSLCGLAGTVLVAAVASGAAGGAASLGVVWTLRRQPAAWPERARQVFAAKQGMVLAVIITPFLCSAVNVFFDASFSLLPGRALVAAAWLTALVVGLGWYRFTAQHWRDRSLPASRAWRSGLAVFLISGSSYVPLLVGWLSMPNTFGVRAAVIFAAVLFGIAVLACGGGFRLARALGLVHPAPPRLERIVAGMAARVGVRPRSVYVLEWPMVNALALPLSRTLAFSDTALEVFSDDELAAVAGHELGHLGEPPRVLLARVAGCFLMAPLVLIGPVSAAHGLLGQLILLLPVMLGARLRGRLSRRLEIDADAVGRAHSADGVYARALERMHEANLLPVVHDTDSTHPHLYDRLISAGAPPAYPRPAPPPRSAVRLIAGAALATAAAVLVAVPVVLRALVGSP